MSKNQKEQKTVAATKIEIVKRKDYKDLVNFVSANQNIDNKEKLQENYEQTLKLKFNNVERLIKRSLREESRANLLSNLKDSNLTLNEYETITYKIINLSRENLSSKFILVEKKN